jgi:hypothetical protein
MHYQIYSRHGQEAIDSLSAQVFARAYHALWRWRRGNEPVGPHTIDSLDMVIDFGLLKVRAGQAAAVTAPPTRSQRNCS